MGQWARVCVAKASSALLRCCGWWGGCVRPHTNIERAADRFRAVGGVIWGGGLCGGLGMMARRFYSDVSFAVGPNPVFEPFQAAELFV